MKGMVRVTGQCLLAVGVLSLSACGDKPANANQVSAAEQVFRKNCKVCHAQGINGAPVVGNAVMWEKRVGQGKATLVQHAIDGFGLMPPKGGNTALTEQEIDSAVTYMLSQLKQ